MLSPDHSLCADGGASPSAVAFAPLPNSSERSGVRACHRSDCSPPHLDLVTKKEVALASLGASQYCKPETPGPQRSCGLPLRNVPGKDSTLLKKKEVPEEKESISR